jgi:tetratricopeptide (TPR) repeat protein
LKQRLLTLGLLLWLCATACVAAGDAATQADLTAAKELHQAKLDAFKDLHQKDVDALRQQVAAVDKRVDDQLAQVGQAVDRFSAQSAWTGILITVLLVLGGFLGYRNAKQEAKQDAKEAASEQGRTTAEHWFELHATALTARIAALEEKARDVHHNMDQHLADVKNHATVSKEDIDRARATAQENIGKPDAPVSPELERSQRVLSQRDQELKNTNEDTYSFEDWDTRAFAAVSAGKLEDAAYFWQKAAGIPNAGATNVAKALFNKGVAQGQLSQPEAAIATFDELLRRFADAPEPALREQVARTLVNKGVTQRQLNQPEAAMATYDELLHHFADAPEPALRHQVAKALNNKGVVQRQLKQPEAAMATYDELLRRFADAPEPALREPVAHALNDRGFTRLMWAKQLGLGSPVTRAHLMAALADFNQAVERMVTSSGMVLGNRAYVHQLLGNAAQAEQDFAAALRAPDSGGQALYEGTLQDLTKHPIPEDAAMRAMVERAWAAYQQAQGTQPPSPPAAPPAPQ